MENTAITIGAVVLAGGTGRRMGGVVKGDLLLEGKPFLARVANELSAYQERILSVGENGCYPEWEHSVVVDRRPDTGPLGGLCAALAACKSDALLAVCCDMPLFQAGMGAYLACFLSEDCDVVLSVDRAGWWHPLCAIYRKTALPVMEENLRHGRLRIRDSLDKLRVREAPLLHSAYPDEVLTNINTAQEYAALLRRVRTGPPVVAISGVKNSGKTTLLEGVLPILAARGLRVGVIKHDGHDFSPDVPGTDSYRLRLAGAAGVAVYSAHRYSLTASWDAPDSDALIATFRAYDLVLLEGYKNSSYPKIEVVRGAVSQQPVCAVSTLLAVATDLPLELPGIASVGIGDYRRIADLIQTTMDTSATFPKKGLDMPGREWYSK